MTAARVFNIDFSKPGSFKSNGSPVAIEELPYCGGGPAFIVWEPAIVLGKLFEYKEFPLGALSGKRCLELGAGCALVSICAAMQGAHVIATDRADVIHHTQRNIDLNAAVIRSKGGSVQARVLDWREDVPDDLGAIDMIFASDIAVSPKSTPLVRFSKTLKSLCDKYGQHQEIYIAHKARSELLDELLYLSLHRMGFEGNVLTGKDNQHPLYSSERVDILKVKWTGKTLEDMPDEFMPGDDE